MVVAVRQLSPTHSSRLYEAVAQWSDSEPELTGTLAQAVAALSFLVHEPDFGIEAVSVVVETLEPAASQAFLVALAGTAQRRDSWSMTRARDALAALTAPPSQAPLDAWIALSLVDLSSLRELNGLRILKLEALPPKKRQALRRARFSVPSADPGERLQKIIKLKDLERYLSGEFSPTVGGAVTIYEQVDFLKTPEELIAGLRLDYPGGFSGEKRVGALLFPRPQSMWLCIPFDPMLGGTPRPDLVYPFTGTGFTANIEGRLVPELVLLEKERQPLPVGAELFEIDEDGVRHLRAVLGESRTWLPAQLSSPSLR